MIWRPPGSNRSDRRLPYTASFRSGRGGRGVLLVGVTGLPAADVVILGGGVVGVNAARIALGMEARVTVVDKSLRRLTELDLLFGAKLNTLFSTDRKSTRLNSSH